MGLVNEQAAFLQDVAKLLAKAWELGFVVTAGEVYRTLDQQKLYVLQGRSKTLNSRHLERMAIDLNCFRKKDSGELRLTYDKDELQPLGDYWEGLSDKNRWGGNWQSFKDTPHFERR